jgi:NADPH-dependent glutamate synthase beta chain and related oxidoreductases
VRADAARQARRERPPAAEPVPGSEFVLLADTAIKALGQEPRAELLRWIDGLTWGRGRIEGDPESGQTTNERWFAAGDAVNGATVVEAVGGAKRAARGIDAFLGGLT